MIRWQSYSVSLVSREMKDDTAETHAIQPWESSPEVFTKAAHILGLAHEFEFMQVLSLEDPLPQNTVALILVYPTPSDYETQKTANDRLADCKQSVVCEEDHDIIWLRQRVHNACGPYALLHAIFNSIAREHLSELCSSEQCESSTADAFAARDSLIDTLHADLKSNATRVHDSIVREHGELWRVCAQIGEMGESQSLQDLGDEVEPHFVCFANVGGCLGLFDGDRDDGLRRLDIRLAEGGYIVDGTFEAVQSHLDTYSSDGRDFCTLLSLTHRQM